LAHNDLAIMENNPKFDKSCDGKTYRIYINPKTARAKRKMEEEPKVETKKQKNSAIFDEELDST
jgi:penicillin V acylase-like amidase (Ntn superfamily)